MASAGWICGSARRVDRTCIALPPASATVGQGSRAETLGTRTGVSRNRDSVRVVRLPVGSCGEQQRVRVRFAALRDARVATLSANPETPTGRWICNRPMAGRGFCYRHTRGPGDRIARSDSVRSNSQWVVLAGRSATPGPHPSVGTTQGDSLSDKRTARSERPGGHTRHQQGANVQPTAVGMGEASPRYRGHPVRCALNTCAPSALRFTRDRVPKVNRNRTVVSYFPEDNDTGQRLTNVRGRALL